MTASPALALLLDPMAAFRADVSSLPVPWAQNLSPSLWDDGPHWPALNQEGGWIGDGLTGLAPHPVMNRRAQGSITMRNKLVIS